MQPENIDEKEILTGILNSKKEIEKYIKENPVLFAGKKYAFLSFWDFDGTILKGDCSEGLKDNGKEIFKGLVELGILKGYSKEFTGEEGVRAFWKKYRDLEEIDKLEAYLFLPRLFADNLEEVILDLAREHFKTILKKYYFPSSIRILEKLKSEGIQSYIVSASSDFFVKGMIGTIPIEADCMYGIEMKINKGIITTQEVLPVTYAEGKRKKLKQIVAKLLESKKADLVFVLAGFGNSFHTDGPFMKYIAEQKLEAGIPITVMINGGNAPAQYKGIFKEVSFDI